MLTSWNPSLAMLQGQHLPLWAKPALEALKKISLVGPEELSCLGSAGPPRIKRAVDKGQLHPSVAMERAPCLELYLDQCATQVSLGAAGDPSWVTPVPHACTQMGALVLVPPSWSQPRCPPL